MNRRSILKLFSAAPMAGPAAAKAVLDEHAAGLAALTMTGVGSGSNSPGLDSEDGFKAEQLTRALSLPQTRGRIISHLYQDEFRHVHCLDADLAANRSFSLAAKVVFQRQRNVERELENLQRDVPYWKQMKHIIYSGLGLPWDEKKRQ